MSTAQQILQAAQEKFNMGINDLYCPSVITECTCTGNFLSDDINTCSTNTATCNENTTACIGNTVNCSNNKDVIPNCKAHHDREDHTASTKSPSNAKYCAGFDPDIHYSSASTYNCPGHRDSNQSLNKYSSPTDLAAENIIKADQIQQLYSNIKSEIEERLSHYFYDELSY